MVGHCASHHLCGNVISETVGLVYVNLQPEYELPSLTRFRQFQKSDLLSSINFRYIYIRGPKIGAQNPY